MSLKNIQTSLNNCYGSKMKKTNLIFPMAGEASRFGYSFKPFMKLGDQTFIEKAVEPFYKWREYIDKVYFIYRQDQEDDYSVSEYLFNNIDFEKDEIVPIIIPGKTKGPLETIYTALRQEHIKNSIVCDCDHQIKVDNLFDKIIETGFERTVIPVWEIDESESKNWSKIIIDGAKIINIVEKEKVDFDKYNVWGILGCIYFPNMDYFLRTDGVYVSDVCRNILKTEDNLAFSAIDQAFFFGDPEMLENHVNQRRNQCSFFFDIDGVLLKHNDHSSNEFRKNLPLKDNIKILKQLKQNNHKIFLTTARSTKYREGLEGLLKKMDIPYDGLMTGMASGPRVLVNDRKPSKPFTTQANAVESYRNEPLVFDIKKLLEKNSEVVESDLSANSGALTYLMRRGTERFIRKIVRKNTDEYLKHIDILKRQYFDLQRLNSFKPGICPNVISSTENNLEYYIDIEYLEEYQKLNAHARPVQAQVLKRVIRDLRRNVYCYSKSLNKTERTEFFNNFIESKIITKLNNFSIQNPLMKRLINGDCVYINGKKYRTLKEIFNNKNIIDFAPKEISPVHGDLTLENILYNTVLDDYKLIDMDGAKLMDTRYLDLGKLSQSVLSHYEEWNDYDLKISFEGDNFTCDSSWFELRAGDETFINEIWSFREGAIENAIFYMGTYFIRFTPFRLKKGINHGIFALIMAVVWLNKLSHIKEKS